MGKNGLDLPLFMLPEVFGIWQVWIWYMMKMNYWHAYFFSVLSKSENALASILCIWIWSILYVSLKKKTGNLALDCKSVDSWVLIILGVVNYGLEKARFSSQWEQRGIHVAKIFVKFGYITHASGPSSHVIDWVLSPVLRFYRALQCCPFLISSMSTLCQPSQTYHSTGRKKDLG